MDPDIILLVVVVMIIGFTQFQVAKLHKRMASFERKLNTLLANMGIDPHKTDFVGDSINQIAELYRAGKVDEAKQLAKDTLDRPRDFKKAWKVCEEKPASTL